mgnify:CR=1 FL=1
MIVFSHIYARIKLFYDNSMTLIQEKTLASKVRGDFADVATDIAALFFDAQHGGAMRMQREGVPNDTIARVLGTGLRMPISNANIIGF